MKFLNTIILTLLCSVAINAQAFEQASIQQWQGAAYNENSQLQSHWADRFFFKHYVFKGNEQVLDIGSGDGKLTARIASLVPQGNVIGIDNSESMYKEAISHYTHPNLQFKNQNAQEVEFYQTQPNHFDLIVSFSTLHWVKEQEDVLQGIYHALKNQGKCYLKLSSKGGDPIQEIADKLKASNKYQTLFKDFNDPMTRFSQEDYQALLQKSHLSVISIKDVEEKDAIQGKENLIKQIKSWLPHYHYLKQYSAKHAEPFLAEVIDTYLQQYAPDQNGTITLYDHYLEVIAQKNV